MKYATYHFGKVHLLIIFILLLSTSCKKDYLTDGGVSTARSPLTTYEYLSNQKYHDFDTVLMIVDHFGLKDSVNNSGTFIAPTDFCITRFMNSEKITTLDSLYLHISSKFLTQYMFSDTAITLTKVGLSVSLYPNWADTLSGFKKTAFTYVAANSAFTYYVLQYIQINGALDGSPTAPPDDPADAVLNCQTTGILTESGTNLNILANNSNLVSR